MPQEDSENFFRDMELARAPSTDVHQNSQTEIDIKTNRVLGRSLYAVSIKNGTSEFDNLFADTFSSNSCASQGGDGSDMDQLFADSFETYDCSVYENLISSISKDAGLNSGWVPNSSRGVKLHVSSSSSAVPSFDKFEATKTLSSNEYEAEKLVAIC
jgi:hypothetical protein